MLFDRELKRLAGLLVLQLCSVKSPAGTSHPSTNVKDNEMATTENATAKTTLLAIAWDDSIPMLFAARREAAERHLERVIVVNYLSLARLFDSDERKNFTTVEEIIVGTCVHDSHRNQPFSQNDVGAIHIHERVRKFSPGLCEAMEEATAHGVEVITDPVPYSAAS